jgi:acyl-CoA thioesterase I
LVMMVTVARQVLAASGESVVLVGTEPANLLFRDVHHLRVHSTYEGGTEFAVGKDYTIDAAAGTIARTAASSIPDYSTNILYGRKDFVHDKFPGYGNRAFFVYVDYDSPNEQPLASKSDQSGRLMNMAAKLHASGSFKIIAFGDSITAGGETSRAEFQFPNRYGAFLQKKFPQVKISVENGATGGDNTINGLARLREKVLTRSPDLVLIGFGMNDHNVPGVGGVEPGQFKANLKSMIDSIHKETHADVILFSTFPPNPNWHYGTHRMEQYATATREAADETSSAYADVYGVFMRVLERKNPESLLANNINHPNDFGHWLYEQALEAVQFER